MPTIQTGYAHEYAGVVTALLINGLGLVSE